MHLHPSADWDFVRDRFRHIWGYDNFRAPQGEIIQSLLTQQDALIVMPTGGGKSVCFQLPALLRHGLTLVVSPLVALMENQVQDLRQRRQPAALLHAELSVQQRKRTLWELENQRLRLLYLSPETLLSPPVWQRLCQPNLLINGLVLDEAHCLALWGEAFRPAYRRLGAARLALQQTQPAGEKLPIAAFTATADPQTQQIIQQGLQLNQPQVFLQNPYRANLSLGTQIVWTARARRQRLLRFIQERSQQAGLVYVRTRREGEELASWLTQQGFQTAAYHAGLNPADRRRLEADWLTGSLQFVVCTSAFGMGIDKPACRWVVHFHAPLLLSEYVQEVGRAGRDGKPAQALTLISEPTGWLDASDKQRQQFFQRQMQQQRQQAQAIVHQLPPQGSIQSAIQQFPTGAIALSLLHSNGQLSWQDPFHYTIERAAIQPSSQLKATAQMRQYLYSKRCRWRFLLDAFGFEQDAEALGQCGHCDRCRKP
ncbi:ATP-dependent DNA helicase RecQ [Phormidium tenue FACHB-886]|nr:ATP-dependent DNA helicase RecQ [Phormidium tenue FACHB-886]